MFGIDLTTLLIILGAAVLVWLALDFLLAGGGMTSAMMSGAAQCGAAALGSPFGWALILVVVVGVLALFGVFFGAR